MKKIVPTKPLHLATESIRRLADQELVTSAGGLVNTRRLSDCYRTMCC